MAAGEFKMDISASLVRDMIYGAVEHRTWSFLRNEGDFNLEETADGITEIIYQGLAKSTAREPIEQTAVRLENVAEQLETLAAANPVRRSRA